MNVLKKILEEIDKKADYYETDEQGRENVRMVDMVNVEEIICSHMDEVMDMHGKRLIDADLLMRKCKEWLKPKAPDEDEIVSLADIAVSMIMEIEEQPTVYVNDGWISVEERLPNEREFQESYCRNHYAAEFLVTIEGATKPTTLYFKNNRWFDEERNYYKVIAWQPLPERCKGGDDRA